MSTEGQLPDLPGPYRLADRIGEGGMGVVFLAHDASGRKVALKVLRQAVAGDPTARRRLAREVETMRRVRSPYVAEIIDADLAGDLPYIVTRYVPGRTLEEVVTQGGPLPGPALARLACGLADALAAIHAAGVVHRDLKPSNVLLVGDVPVVIDFGIAQGPDATRLTMTGMFMGTPGYLAPEVIEGQPSSEASDIHAWGATVAFAASGRPPYGTGAYEAIFYRIVNGQPDLAGVPPPMLGLLAAALSRNPALRPPAAQLAARAALLDPGSLLPEGVSAGAGMPVPVTAVQPDGPGLAPGAGGPAGQVPLAPAGALAAPGSALPGAGRLVPADFADVLPPVRYQPDGDRRSGYGASGSSPGSPFAPHGAAATGTAAGTGWSSVMAFTAMVVAAGVSVILPVAGTVAALALIIVLRAGELAQQRDATRRSTRGVRRGDPILVAATFPWYLFRSLLGSALLVPFALAAALVTGAVTILVVPSHQLSRAVAVAAGALVAFYGFGPGSARSRRQLKRIFAASASTRLAQAVVLAGLAALALAILAAAVSWPSLYWPATPPNGFWHFGVVHVRRLGHVGLPGQLLSRWPGV